MDLHGRRALTALTAAGFAVGFAIATLVFGVLVGSDDSSASESNCAGAAVIADEANDVRAPDQQGELGSNVGQGSPDIFELAVRASESGICVRWVTSVVVPAGTTLHFSATGPYIDQQALTYAFHVELSAGGDRVLDPEGAQLEAEVSRSGAAVTAFVPASEIVTDRPFPYERFSFRSTAYSPDMQQGDPIPDIERPDLGYDNGRVCPAPCGDLALDQSRQSTPGSPRQTASDVGEVANDLCRRAQHTLNRLERPSTPSEVVRYAQEAIFTIGAVEGDLRGTEPPPSYESLLGHLEQVMASVEELQGIDPTDRFVMRPIAAQVDEAMRRARLEARNLQLSDCERFGLAALAPAIGFPTPNG